MKDGAYQYTVEMTVPRGIRNGSLDIAIHSGALTGNLTMFTNTQPIFQGIYAGSGISFIGEMRTMTSVISYTAEGTISPTRLKLVFHTEHGDYPAIGGQAIIDPRRA